MTGCVGWVAREGTGFALTGLPCAGMQKAESPASTAAMKAKARSVWISLRTARPQGESQCFISQVTQGGMRTLKASMSLYSPGWLRQ